MVVPIRRYLSLEITTGAAPTTIVTFPQRDDLNDALILAIDVYWPPMITYSTVTKGTPLSLADMKQCTVTLYQGSDALVQQVPLLHLNRFQDTGTSLAYAREQTTFKDLVVSWQQCTLNFQAPPTANTILSLGITYLKPFQVMDANGRPTNDIEYR